MTVLVPLIDDSWLTKMKLILFLAVLLPTSLLFWFITYFITYLNNGNLY